MDTKDVDLSEFPEELKTGIDELDRQHMTLFLMIDDIDHHTKNDSDEHYISDLVHFLKSYVDVHFKTEESYMEKAKYPHMAEHKKIHDAFIEEVETLYKNLSDPIAKITIEEETIDTIKSWIINHVKHTDINMATYLKEKLTL